MAEAKYANFLMRIIKSSIQREANDLTLHDVLDLIWTLSGKFIFWNI